MTGNINGPSSLATVSLRIGFEAATKSPSCRRLQSKRQHNSRVWHQSEFALTILRANTHECRMGLERRWLIFTEGRRSATSARHILGVSSANHTQAASSVKAADHPISYPR